MANVLKENQVKHPDLERGTDTRVQFVKAATDAGTPACLVRCAQLLKSHKLNDDTIDVYVKTCRLHWEWAEEALKKIINAQCCVFHACSDFKKKGYLACGLTGLSQ
jgi:hypothetical protein